MRSSPPGAAGCFDTGIPTAKGHAKGARRKRNQLARTSCCCETRLDARIYGFVPLRQQLAGCHSSSVPPCGQLLTACEAAFSFLCGVDSVCILALGSTLYAVDQTNGREMAKPGFSTWGSTVSKLPRLRRYTVEKIHGWVEARDIDVDQYISI